MTRHNYFIILSILATYFLCESKNIKATSIIDIFPNLTFENPIDIQSPDDETNRIFIVSQKGKIFVFPNDQEVSSADIFLDISEKIIFGGEQGLIGLAFHPEFKTNGKLFVNYIVGNPLRTIISSFKVSSNLNVADPESEEILLEFEQPFANHNGGQMAFGQDGFLYISLGDGGSGGDPGNRAQNLKLFFGKFLRIDINKSENGKLYGIPDDNPFKGNTEGYLEEIYAYGLRNAWRFSFDKSNNLWAADVGQSNWEEINIIEKGGNYGWRIMEGRHCYDPIENCDTTGLGLPIWEYEHLDSIGNSITGGYVYEKNDSTNLIGKYIYADYLTGSIWTFDPINLQNEHIATYDGRITTFGLDSSNNLLFADYQKGSLHKLVGEKVTSVKNSLMPEFVLYQNFPNPFNPTTVIRYSIEGDKNNISNFVKLEVFDLLGRKVKTLFNGTKSPGYYEVKFDASIFQSGIYFYKLTVGNFTRTKKMILLN